MTVALIGHIDVDENGVARIVGRRTKVLQIAMDKMAHGWSAEEIQAEYPHLTLAQIHAALAYYYDNQVEIDEQIARDVERAESMRDQSRPSPIAEKLKLMGKLS